MQTKIYIKYEIKFFLKYHRKTKYLVLYVVISTCCKLFKVSHKI